MGAALSGIHIPLVAESAAMKLSLRRAKLFAPWNKTVVIVGETGSGKTLLAERIHHWSGRLGRFVAVTARELDEHLGLDMLFGHEAGAFTGANSRRPGLFAEAADGTLLFDDFHLLIVAFQIALLRVLESGMYRPWGVDRDVPIRCRILIGMHQHPDVLVAQGKLIADLRYRLGHCIVGLAPLRDRREDIVPIAQACLGCCLVEKGGGPGMFGPGVLERLESAPWLGNARDLREVVEAAFIEAYGGSSIELKHLPAPLNQTPHFERRGDAASNVAAVRWGLVAAGGDLKAAGELIGAHRNTVARIAKRWGLRGRSREGGSA